MVLNSFQERLKLYLHFSTVAQVVEIFLVEHKDPFVHDQNHSCGRPGHHLSIKTIFPRYMDSHYKDKMVVKLSLSL